MLALRTVPFIKIDKAKTHIQQDHTHRQKPARQKKKDIDINAKAEAMKLL